MRIAKLLFKSMASRTPRSEYSALLNKTLEKFREDLTAGIELVAELEEVLSGDELNAWGIKYTQWQLQTQEGKVLKLQLVERRPNDRSLLKLHNGLIALMNNRNIEQTQTFNMFLASVKSNHAEANQARDKANRADRDGDAALEYCRKQIAKLQSEQPELIASLHLPDWVVEM